MVNQSIEKQPLGALFKSNFASGLVVFLVALPLCLGIALASGAPPLSGVISGIVGGIVIGFLSTSNISVSGPAAGLAAIVLESITSLGAFELFLCAGLIAGAIQLVSPNTFRLPSLRVCWRALALLSSSTSFR